jgi:hypothetical protein
MSRHVRAALEVLLLLWDTAGVKAVVVVETATDANNNDSSERAFIVPGIFASLNKLSALWWWLSPEGPLVAYKLVLPRVKGVSEAMMGMVDQLGARQTVLNLVRCSLLRGSTKENSLVRTYIHRPTHQHALACRSNFRCKKPTICLSEQTHIILNTLNTTHP